MGIIMLVKTGKVTPDTRRTFLPFEALNKRKDFLRYEQNMRWKGQLYILTPKDLLKKGQLYFSTPEDLKDWEVVKKLGQGTTGAVYLIKDKDGRKAAVKIIVDHYLNCFKELSVQGALTHPSLCRLVYPPLLLKVQDTLKKYHPLYDTLKEYQPLFDQRCREYQMPLRSSQILYLCIFMEYIPETIYDLMKFFKQFSLVQTDPFLVRLVLFDLFRALYALHRKGLTHTDVKPANILIDMKCRVKVCDFGCTEELDGILDANIGTHGYRAPELVFWTQNNKHIKYTNAIDMWSAGIVIYEFIMCSKFFNTQEIRKLISTHKKFEKKPKNTSTYSDVYSDVFGLPETPYEFKNVLHKRFEQSWVGKDNEYEFQQLFPNELINLMSGLFIYSPKERITALDALKHNYFKPLRKAYFVKKLEFQDYEIEELLNEQEQKKLDIYYTQFQSEEDKAEVDQEELDFFKKYKKKFKKYGGSSDDDDDGGSSGDNKKIDDLMEEIHTKDIKINALKEELKAVRETQKKEEERGLGHECSSIHNDNSNIYIDTRTEQYNDNIDIPDLKVPELTPE